MCVHRFVRHIAGILLASLVGGCVLPDATDPNTYPYRLEEAHKVAAFTPVDLEGDGRDERVFPWRRGGPESAPNAIVLATLDRRTIQQVNYAGTVVDEVQALDLDSDGTLEVLVPVLRNDSLYLSVVSATGRKQEKLFVMAGEPRQEPEGTLPWDPAVRSVEMADATGNGQAELIVTAVTRYARHPRGVWVFSWPGRQLQGKHEVGALINRELHLGHFDEDGYPELFFGSSASDNGAVAGGLDDQHAYIGAFELRGVPRLEWTRALGDIWSSALVAKGDVDGDGTTDVFTYEWKQRGRATPVALQHIDPGTGRVIRQRTFDQQIRDVATIDLDGDGRDEVLVVNGDGDVEVLSGTLDLRRRHPMDADARHVAVLPDVDTDGVDEVILTTDQGAMLLDRDLTLKAYTPVQSGRWAIVRRGGGQPPYVYAQTGDRAVLMTLQPNPLYLWHRYGPWMGWLIGVMGLVGLGWVGYALYGRMQQLHRARHQVFATSDDGLLILADGEIESANPAVRRLLGQEDSPLDWIAVERRVPGITPLIEHAAQQNEPVDEEVPLSDDPGRSVLARVVPLDASASDPSAERGRWLIRLQQPASISDGDYHTWGLMARRVAHDLKNPLTSMLLTLQRLQMEYRDRAPDAADDLDTYTARIEERIEHLRRMTKNFMKFIDAETPSLARTDLNAYLDARIQVLRSGLPPDIHLRLKQDPDLPPVRIDAEQMDSVLENLIGNAVNALPEGGQITIATRLERGLQLEPGASPRDYVELEVLDTGVGMEATVRERLFEPGFTTSEDGTGLGLAIVQKVVRDHGGHLHVESERGTGSAIGLFLPVDQDGAEPPA